VLAPRQRLSYVDGIIRRMNLAAEPRPFIISRAKVKRDFASGLWPYRWCLIWVGYKAFQIILLLGGMLIMLFPFRNTPGELSLTDQIQTWISKTGVHGCVHYFLTACFIVLGVIAALRLIYLTNVWLLRWLASWQQRHTWGILTGTDVLVAMLLSDDLKGPKPDETATGTQQPSEALASDTRRLIRSGTATNSLEALAENFDTACRRMRLHGVPPRQVRLQRLVVTLPIVSMILTYFLYIYIFVFVINPKDPRYFSYNSPAFHNLQLVFGLYLAVIWLTVCFAVETIQAARRIGIRLALMDYFTAESFAVNSGDPEDKTALPPNYPGSRHKCRLPAGDKPC
jgi:hypothetical protein